MSTNEKKHFQPRLAIFQAIIPHSFAYNLHSDFNITFDTIGFSTVGDKSYYYKLYYGNILFPDENHGVIFQIKNYFHAFSRNLMTKERKYYIGNAFILEAKQKDKNPYLKCTIKIRDDEKIVTHDFYLDRAECSIISDALHQVIMAHKKIFFFKQ